MFVFMTRRTPIRLALLSLVTAVLAACGTGAAAQPTAASTLKVGDQQQFLQTLFAASGALKGAPYRAQFDEFNSGPLVDAGFAAGRIDIGFMGDLPASLAARSGLPVKAVAVLQPIGASMYLLAKPGITSIAQLKGRPVAYTTGTAEQAFALRALARAGLGSRDVRQVDVSLLQLGTVLETGAADASVVSVEQKVDYERTHPGATVLATIDSVTPPSYLYVLASDAALANPAKRGAIDDFLKRFIQASNWQKSHTQQYIDDYYVGVEHQTAANARLILAAGGSYNFVPLTGAEQTALQTVVGLLASAGALPAPFRVAPLFDPTASARYNRVLQEVPQNG